MAGPLIGMAARAAAAAGAKAAAKKGGKEAAEEAAEEAAKKAADKELRQMLKEKAIQKEMSKTPKGGSVRQSEGRIGRGYREYETSSPRLSDEYIPYMRKGGSVSARADGCAVKGKTKGRFV